MKDRFKIVGLAFLSLALVAGAGTDVEEGNKLYHDGKYGEALAKYSEAQADDPEAPGIYFDIGNIYYMQEDYGKALDLYKKAAAAENPDLQSSAYYNMGNAKYRLGKGESSIPIYEEAIGNYARALTVNPADIDAKNNLEYVRREIEKLKNQQQQQQQQQDKEKEEEEQEQEKEKEQEQEQEQQEEEEKDKEKEQEQEKKEEKEKEKDKDKGKEQEQNKQEQQQEREQEQKEDEKKEQQQQQQQDERQEQGEISEEEAARFLDSHDEEERMRREMKRRKVPAADTRVEKDW